jgi:hypothetical protein
MHIANCGPAEIPVKIYCTQQIQTLKERRGIQVSNLIRFFNISDYLS